MKAPGRLLMLWAALLALTGLLSGSAAAAAPPSDQIEALVQQRMRAGKIPGLAVVVVQGEQITYLKGFGYSDQEHGRPVTGETGFELGSNTKAYTGLALLQLEQQGLLRLDDPVSKYVPWFYVTYQGERMELTLEQLLYQKTAIPPESLGSIPRSTADGALEAHVRLLSGTALKPVKNRHPGEYFEYSTVNYDVLGLVIQTVSGLAYEDYMQQRLLQLLGLSRTFAHQEEAAKNGLAVGYKLGFTAARPYAAPRYRGNAPAGYLSATPQDVAEWMKIQLGTKRVNGFDPALFKRSQEPDRMVPPGPNGASYAAGWYVFQRGSGEVAHGGENPNFSSFVLLRPGDGIGVAVLANMNSTYTESIARGVLALLQGRTPMEPQPDPLGKLDKIASTVLVVAALATVALLGFLVWASVGIVRGARRFAGLSPKQLASTVAALASLGLYLAGLNYLPGALIRGIPWAELNVWAPFTLVPAVIAMAVLGCVFLLYHLLTLFFPREREQPYVSLLMFGIVSGFGNAFVIFVVNQTFGQQDNLTNGLLFYFLLGIVMYIFGQRYILTKLVAMTNDLVYERRMDLIRKILRTPYHKLEAVADGKVQTVLNNDTEVVSRSMSIVVSGATSLITLICCFIYLGLMNLYALLLSMAVIALAAGLYFLFGHKAKELWEETREIQVAFFQLMNDLLNGFKELRLNYRKGGDYAERMEQSCDLYRTKRTEGDLRFANVTVAGELLFTLVIGTVAFFFPVIFPSVLDTTLQAFVFVFLYMTGPVNGILNSYPAFVQVRISWQRIHDLEREIAILQGKGTEPLYIPEGAEPVELTLRDVAYSYESIEGRTFRVGPLNLTFRSGEISFITGGNGSGKTTVAKLITGLYVPQQGALTLNGKPLPSEQVSQYYSAIFSDYYLFDRLYGVDLAGRKEVIKAFLERFELFGKVAVVKGCFSTTALSTGQKKRLALLLSYLEDRPICLFDEWAADQDPEFRRYFYQEILPELRARGKCIIAITHDDRYFHIADQVIKLETGKVVQDSALAEVAGSEQMASLSQV